MTITWLEILSYVLIIDSVGALWVAWYGRKWYLRHVGILARYLPPAKGWAAWYFTLALFISWLINGGAS